MTEKLKGLIKETCRIYLTVLVSVIIGYTLFGIIHSCFSLALLIFFVYLVSVFVGAMFNLLVIYLLFQTLIKWAFSK